MAEVFDLAAIAAAFGDRLHRAGVPVTPERSARFAQAVDLTAPRDLNSLYWVGRTTLLSSRDQIDVYERVFSQVFRGEFRLGDLVAPTQSSPEPAPRTGDDRTGELPNASSAQSGAPEATGATPSDEASDDADANQPSVLAAMSEVERLNDRDFSQCSDDELALIRRLVEQLPLIPPMRHARRTRRRRSGDRWDVRATLRRAHRTGGDPVRLVERRRTEQPRRVVLIADVSGSMEPYSRIFLHLMRGAVQALNAEAFVFATHLTRLTKALGEGDADAAYVRAAAAATDWSGGTRIGRALQDFIGQHGRRGMARGAVVVIVSDGWEIEDPELVARSMEQLSRLAHHIIWVNPRKAVRDYEPLVRGMAAALPYVDTFVSGHSVHALQDVMAAISGARTRRSASAVGSRVAS